MRRLIAAYDDAAGVTAAFNLNLLHRANRELGADFDVAGFAHAATYDVRNGRIDMHLVSRAEQSATRARPPLPLHGGRAHPHRAFAQVRHRGLPGAGAALPAGGRKVVWTDAERLFSVHVLVGRLIARGLPRPRELR